MRVTWLAFVIAIGVSQARAEPLPDEPGVPRYHDAEDPAPPPDDAPVEAPDDTYEVGPPDDEDPDNPSAGGGAPVGSPQPVKRKPPSPFAQGKMHIGVGGGLLSSRDRVDFGLELSYGVFVIDNIEVGADTAFQVGDSPFAAYLGPTVRVLFPVSAFAAPYLGGFYRHWFLTQGFEDFDTLGVRAGLMVSYSGAHLYFGIVYEAIVSECIGDCGDFYPELGVNYFF